jgi:hypothetical protein
MGMHVDEFEFGHIRIDGKTYEHDVVLEEGVVRKRKKGPSRHFKGELGHTPLSLQEDIPWAKCERLVIGTGAYGRLPVMDEVKREAKRRGVELVIEPTARAIDRIESGRKRTHAILHVTC